MRSFLLSAALAALAVAVPHKRDLEVVIETATDLVWVTQVVTVTATGGAPSATAVVNHAVDPPPAATFTVQSSATHTWHGHRHSTTASPEYSAPAVASSIVVPVYTSSEAPAVVTSVTPPEPIASSAAPVVQASETSADVVSSKPTDYSSIIVAHHNMHRRNHSAPDIVWDTNLANTAAKIAASCNYAHDTQTDKSSIGGYGQNIAAGIGANNVSVIITELFYNGEVNSYDGLYGQSAPSMVHFDSWGHFSQIVWHDTTKVGCATQQCDTLQGVGSKVPPVFTVCNYQSPGNVANGYTAVGASQNMPTIHWDYFN